MLYFVQGFYFAENGMSFLEDKFEAWPYGPTIRSLYEIYSVNGSLWIKNIEGRKLDPKKNKRKGSLIENILIKEYFQNNIRKYS